MMLQPILNRGYKFKELPKQTKIAVGNNSLVTPRTLEMVETWHARHWGHGGFRRHGGLVPASLHNWSLATQPLGRHATQRENAEYHQIYT